MNARATVTKPADAGYPMMLLTFIICGLKFVCERNGGSHARSVIHTQEKCLTPLVATAYTQPKAHLRREANVWALPVF
jgi:hypothetical protein